MHFPTPYKLGEASTRWKLSEILAYEAEKTGAPAPDIPARDDRYLSDVQVAERLGVGRNTVWRWAKQKREAAQCQ